MKFSDNYVAVAGESPWWDPVAKSVLWVDIRGQRVLETDPVTGSTQIFEVSGMPSLAVPMQSGELLCATREGLLALNRGSGMTRPLFRPGWLTSDMRFNDGTVDPMGRLVIGTMSMDGQARPLNGALYVVAQDQTAHRLLDKCGIINGLAFSVDGSVLYVADSHPDRRVIWQFDYDKRHPRLSNRRTIADFKAMGLSGTPDGAAIDATGTYWVAAHGAGKLLRFGEGGGSQEVPCSKVSKLAFVGKHRASAAVTGFESKLMFLDIAAHGPPLPALNW